MKQENNLKYFLNEDIESELKCLACNCRYDVPKLLPACGCSICSKCESHQKKFVENNIIKLKCPICKQTNDLMSNQLAVNKFIQKFLLKKPREAERGELHKNATIKLKEIKSMQEIFERDLTNSDEIVYSYCKMLRNEIYIKTESAKLQLDKHRDNFIEKINQYEKRCLENTNNLTEFKKFIQNNEQIFKTWWKYLDQTCLVDSVVSKIILEADKVKQVFDIYKKKLEEHLLETDKLEFIKSEFKLDKSLIGSFKNSNATVLKKLRNLNSQTKINYNQDISEYNEDSIKTSYYPCNDESNKAIRTCAIEIGDDEFLVLSLMQSTYELRLTVYSKDGIISRQKSEKNMFNQGYGINDIFAVSHPSQDWFVIGCGYSIYKYNNQLQKLQQITTQNIFSGLYLHDSDLYVNISNKYFLKFDEDLKQQNITKKNIPKQIFSTQLFFKYGKIYSFKSNQLRIYDLETFCLLQSIDNPKCMLPTKFEFGGFFNDELDLDLDMNHTNIQHDIISEDTFVSLNQIEKKLEIYNLKYECILILLIDQIDQISSYFITRNGNLAIIDSNAGTLYLFESRQKS